MCHIFFFTPPDSLPVYSRVWKKRKIHVVQTAENAALPFYPYASTDTMMFQESVVDLVLCEERESQQRSLWLL